MAGVHPAEESRIVGQAVRVLLRDRNLVAAVVDNLSGPSNQRRSSNLHCGSVALNARADYQKDPLRFLGIKRRRRRRCLGLPAAHLGHFGTQAEVLLRFGVALIGCLAVPERGLSVVLQHAGAVRRAEIGLRFGVPLVGGFPILREGLRVVLRHALAGLVHHAKIVLSPDISLLGSLVVP